MMKTKHRTFFVDAACFFQERSAGKTDIRIPLCSMRMNADRPLRGLSAFKFFPEVCLMKSCEDLVAPVSDYFIYSPSRMAQETFLYPLQCGLFS